jgi:hypothetical protein
MNINLKINEHNILGIKRVTHILLLKHQINVHAANHRRWNWHWCGENAGCGFTKPVFAEREWKTTEPVQRFSASAHILNPTLLAWKSILAASGEGSTKRAPLMANVTIQKSPV